MVAGTAVEATPVAAAAIGYLAALAGIAFQARGMNSRPNPWAPVVQVFVGTGHPAAHQLSLHQIVLEHLGHHHIRHPSLGVGESLELLVEG